MQTGAKLDLESIIDASPVSRFQIGIMALCALVAMLDGCDTQTIAFVAPAIIKSWHIAPSAFGPVFGAGLLGGLFGAIVFGVASDRFGRKPILLGTVLLFSVGSLLTPLCESLASLTAVRFVTGLGLGGALPCFVSLTSEYAPKRLRASLVTTMFCGFPLGAVIGGFVSAQLIPAFGWSSVFIVGGVLPLLIIPFLAAFAPESARFLELRRDHKAIARLLQRMHSQFEWSGEVPRTGHGTRVPVVNLFREGRALGTVLLWITLFMSLLLTYFLVNWVPVVAGHNGLSIASAVRAASMLNFGSIFGCIVLGRLADRFGTARVVGSGFALGAIAIGLIGQAGTSAVLLGTVAFMAGFFSIGAQICTVAMCAGFYDTFSRATGIGWSMGVGRLGAIVGPVLGGVLLSAGMSSSALFLVVGSTSVGAALTSLAIGRFVLRRRRSQSEGAPAYTSGTSTSHHVG
ncbi:MFS transporter [Paraburkholderia susongensis]|uniref:MFS transporter, AAHS family, 4-hydroxybenzoate transporter n=1 Tax=Paraburkholderia susongensis TaxID=1515439 RepID=A0A1X7M3M0_9BURK|nr:MFS transporter [Paraburkholderia susongensis]SMG60092.1 MFS transporter, AAHS family, 4-hydroxybenzoate transporter [Paraburkholderia susongensis]